MKAVVKVAIEHQGEVLFLHRAPAKRNGELWDLPGGKLEDGELLDEGLAREVFEETGLSIASPELLLLDSNISNGQTVIVATYVTSEYAGNLQLSPEHTRYEWLDPSTISDNQVHPGLISAMAALRKRAQKS